MRAEASIGQLLFGQTRGRLLAALYTDPGSSLYSRQLARLVQGSAGTVQRELTTLIKAGLILREQTGNQVHYRANLAHPVFPEIRSLLLKTTGVFHVLENALAPLAEHIEFAFVYGSFARGEQNAASDIDLMAIGEVTLTGLLEHLQPAELRLARPINPSVYPRAELRARLNARNHFLRALQQAPLVFLIGNENEFRNLR